VSQEGTFYGQETARPPAQPPAAPSCASRSSARDDARGEGVHGRADALFTSAQEFGLALAAIESDMNSLPQDVREALELGREVAKAVKNFQRIVRRADGGQGGG